MNQKLNWEQLDGYNQRAKVFGGWIVKTYEDCHISLHDDMPPQTGYEWRIATCFVPDQKHEWTLEDESS